MERKYKSVKLGEKKIKADKKQREKPIEKTRIKQVALPIFKSCVRLEISGLNQPRLLSAFIKDGINLKNINRLGANIMNVDIAKKNSKKAFAILEKMCYTYNVIAHSGVDVALRVAANRVGLIIGLVIFTALITLSRGFIWRLELSGCENLSEQTVKILLKESNIGVGKSLKNVDKKSLRNSLNGIDGVLESSVEIVGTTVKIIIVEATDFTPPPITQSTDIVSKFDAQISKIVALKGTCLVARGQKVFKGDPLIGAYRLSPEGEKAEQTDASGTVYGLVTFTRSYCLSTREYIFVPTGETYKSSVYNIFGLKIGKSKNPFEFYSSVSETIYPFDGAFIPLKLQRETITELKSEQVEHDVNELAAATAAKSVVDNVIKCGGSEIKTTTSLKQIGDGLYTLNVFMQAEMPIS